MEIRKILKEAEFYGDAIVSVTHATRKEVDIARDSLSNFFETDAVSLSVRIVKGRKYGFAKTDNLGKWKDCVRTAGKILRLSKPLKTKIPVAGGRKFPQVNSFSEEVEKLDMKDLSNFGTKLIKSVKKENYQSLD